MTDALRDSVAVLGARRPGAVRPVHGGDSEALYLGTLLVESRR